MADTSTNSNLSENNISQANELEDITKVILAENNVNESSMLDEVISNAPAQQSFEKSTMLDPVKVREYATNPDAQLDKITSRYKADSKTNTQKAADMEAKPKSLFDFNFTRKQETKQLETEHNTVHENNANTNDLTDQAPMPDIPSMRFEKPDDVDMNFTASQNLTGQIGLTTSDLIWNNFENGLPEIMGSYVVKISETVAEDPIISEDAQLIIKDEIAKRNKENKEKFVIPEWYKDQIRLPLKALCVEKGIETSIPPSVQLLIGIGIMLALFLIPTIMEVKKSNDKYLKSLDLHFESLREIEREKIKQLKIKQEQELKLQKESNLERNPSND